MKKRILSIALCLAMVLTMMPSVAWAGNYTLDNVDWDKLIVGTDTITIDGVGYTYQGDATNNRAYFTTMSGYDIEALAGDFIYKAGEGYILYSHVQDAATAAVTLHGARADGAILPCYGEYGEGMAYTGVNTTVTLEGASTLSDVLYHQAGSTTFLGTGTLALEAGTPCTLSGAVIIGGGAQVTLGDGEQNYDDNKEADFYQLLTVASGAKLTITANTTLISGNSFESAANPGGITVENGGTLENNGIIQMSTKTAAEPGIDGEITGTGVVCFGNDSTPYINAGGNWLACDADEVAAGKVTIEGVDYIKFNGAWVTENSTVTIDGTKYTYKGDATTAGASFYTVGACGDCKPLDGNLVWKAGGGYILYSYQAGGSSAAVTLHEAESAKSISLPFSQDAGSDAGSATGCDTTVTLEGISTLSGCLYHNAGGTTFTGSGTLNLTQNVACEFRGAVTIENGAHVTVGNGNDSKTGLFRQPLTVKSGATLTVATNATLYSESTVENVGTLVNNGIIQMKNKTAADPGISGEITGTGVVHFGSDTTTPYIKVGSEWLASGGDKSSEALDLTTAPTVKTLYTAGTNGTILWEPTAVLGEGEQYNVTSGTLTFDNATMRVTSDEYTATAIKLPNLTGGVNVVFKGVNSITANNNTSATAIKCPGDTTFELKDGNTTLTLNNAKDTYGINASGAVTVNNSGTLTIDSNGQVTQNTISARGQAVTLNGGTLAFKGSKGIAASTITLNGVTVPAGSTLSMYESGSAATVSYGAVSTINGELIMPFQRPYTADDFTHFTGSGTIKVGDTSYIKVGGEWVASGGDVSSAGLDLIAQAPTVETVWQAGNGTVTYTPATTDPAARAQLVFDGATMSVSPAEGDAIAVTLPIDPTDVIFKGQNEINATAQTGNATTFSASALDGTTFTAAAGSKTTLNANGNGEYSYGINAIYIPVEFTGSGELTVNAEGGAIGYAITGNVEFTGGTIIASGETQAFSIAPTFGDGYKPVVTAGASEATAESVADPTATTYTGSKYVKITKYVAPSLGGGGGAGGGLIANPADACKDLIKTIGTVTLDKADEIKAAREAFDKLTPAQKQQVDEKALLDAEAALKALEEEAEKKEENKATTARLKDMGLVARSKLVTLKNGKKAIRIVWFEEKNGKMTAITDLDFDGVEIFRSTQRYQGYGKKPIFTTTKGSYLNTAIDEGETYYYKLRAYKIVDGKRVYTDYSLKAKRTIK